MSGLYDRSGISKIYDRSGISICKEIIYTI